ncbi:unnamed protein product [Clonostachys rhizophaga]|uniref:Uncharacterized protein n=1 Tax=Clonostachys rhizophaga TaxID=160324 RepID=A0A9N9VJR0_9HYPO|nr:unnamed protein product [Clonostachys rhizophaga]
MANKESQKSQIRPPLKRDAVYTGCLGVAPPNPHLPSPIGELDRKGLIGGFGDLCLYLILTILSFQIEPSHRCHQPVDLLGLVHEPKAHDSDHDGDGCEDDGDDAEDDGG